MFSFNESIVFGSMWWGSAMRDALINKKWFEFENFTFIVSEKCFNGEIKLLFNKIFKLGKIIELSFAYFYLSVITN